MHLIFKSKILLFRSNIGGPCVCAKYFSISFIFILVFFVAGILNRCFYQIHWNIIFFVVRMKIFNFIPKFNLNGNNCLRIEKYAHVICDVGMLLCNCVFFFCVCVETNCRLFISYCQNIVNNSVHFVVRCLCYDVFVCCVFFWCEKERHLLDSRKIFRTFVKHLFKGHCTKLQSKPLVTNK